MESEDKSHEKSLETTENPPKEDKHTDDAKMEDKIEQQQIDNSVVELDSTGNESISSLSKSVILLDTPEKSEHEPSTAAGDRSTVDDPMEIGSDTSSLSQTVILLDTPEKDEQKQSPAADKQQAIEVPEKCPEESQSVVGADLDTPKKIANDDSSIIDLATQPEKNEMKINTDTAEPSEGNIGPTSSTANEVPAEIVMYTEKTLPTESEKLFLEKSVEHDLVKGTEPLTAAGSDEMPTAVAAETRSINSEVLNSPNNETVNETPLDVATNVDLPMDADETQVIAENVVSNERPEDLDASMPTIELISSDAENKDTPLDVEEHVQTTTLLDNKCHNNEPDVLEQNTDCEEINEVNESRPEVDGKSVQSNENGEIVETDDDFLRTTEPPIAMDVDESITNESELICEVQSAELLCVEGRPDSTPDPEEQQLLSSVENDDKLLQRVHPVIRVKSMADLFAAPRETDEKTKASTDKKMVESKVGESKPVEHNMAQSTEKMEIEEPEKKEKTKNDNKLLTKVLQNVLKNSTSSVQPTTDSDSGKTSPQNEPVLPASPAATVQNELPPPPKPKRKPISEVKECLNIQCTKTSRDFYEAPVFVISHFQATKKQKTIYVCDECFESVIGKYGELCGALEDKQPLYMEQIPQRPEFVEILDSDEEDTHEETPSPKSICENGTTDKFRPETLALLESELENVIATSLQRININEQMEWNRQILNQKLSNQMNESLAMLDDLKQLQRTADRIYKDTYKGINCLVEEISSWDSTTQKPLQLSNADYPPAGEFKHDTELSTTALYYTIRTKLIATWTPCRLLEKIKNCTDEQMYQVQLLRPLKNKNNTIRTVSRKQLAYGRAPPNRLDVGTRIVAMFNMTGESGNKKHATFYPGVISEPLREYNKWRYLVFFDDGYAQYVIHDDIRVVCESSANVWEDVVAESREFIQTYLQQFSHMRPMVQVQRGQRMMTEWMGKWINAIVNEVDASLVQMYFEDEKRYEWIYRGSTRLGPLYQQHKHLVKPKPVPNKADTTTVSKATDQSTPSSEAPPIQRTFPAQATRDTPQKQREKREQQEKEKRAVAKKSSSLPPRPTVQHLNNSTIYVDEDNKPKGKVVYYTAKRHLPPRKYTPHECSPSCLFQISHNLSTYSPLSKPLLSGWERQICKAKGKKSVVYKAPCGRRLRYMSELHRYLRLTQCTLNVENFDYDFMIHCLAEYVIDTCIINKPDISEGVENMVVPCVNYYDTTMPPPCIYSAKRIPTEGVNLNLDNSFMCGCDCTDDCLDKTKCQCWQLTIAGAKFGNPYTMAEDIGYEYKRLPESVPTGIYECNSSCKCKSNCLNRVAQQPLQMKLQVFKTGNRGWGLRCLNDVPKGSFICCYAGNLLTEQVANEAGEDLGDEYFAELDYIEVVEGLKEGYEPDVANDDDKSSEDEFDPDCEPASKDDSDDEFVSKAYISETRIKTRYRTRNSIDTKKKDEKKMEEKKKLAEKKDADDSSDDERQPISFMPSNTSVLQQDENATATKSIRKLYGKNEAVYIMDAKKTGNIGRYFNHSCSPNLFVQNVFVDTHDLRFPWVSFFASSHIRAGTELTWNYNYDVGSVPGKVLYCQCGADNCRGRLL